MTYAIDEYDAIRARMTELQSTAPAASRQPTVLLVDDDAATRNSMRTMLMLARCRVLDTGDGAEALTMFQTARPVELLVTDIKRPGMDGFSLINAIRQIDREMKILVVSGYTVHQVRSRLSGHSDIHFMEKPFF